MTKTMRFLWLLAVAAALSSGVGRGVEAAHTRAEAPGESPARGTPPRVALAGGAATVDQLVADFLAALRRGDSSAIEALRIDRDDYLDVILPGSVERGEPLQRVDRDKAGPYWWQHLSERSDLHRDALVRDFGGRDLQLVRTRFAKGTKQFANHVAYRRLVIELRDADGETRDLQTGSIAEVDGRFKFISFIRD